MIARLLSPEVQEFIKDHLTDDPFLLSLNAKKEADFPMKEAIKQIQSYQKARHKLPSWTKRKDIIWPPPISIEQASSEITGAHKASLVQGQSIVDLTGGSGVDTSFFANTFDEVHYVESNKQLCEIATHNLGVLSHHHVNVYRQTAEDFLERNKKVFDVIYIDPSRRAKDKKVFKIEDCAPNVVDILPACLKKAPSVLIKLSPLVDITLLLKTLSPNFIWVVGVKNEVKEVLCLVERNMRRCRIEAVKLDGGEPKSEFKFFQRQEKDAISEYSLPQTYLYEPNAAIMKSGAFKLIGKHFGLNKLQQHTHLYTSEQLVENFPGRIFKVGKQIKPSKKMIHQAFPTKKANVISRNYPISASQLKDKYLLKDGGEDFLIATTLMDGAKVLLKSERKV